MLKELNFSKIVIKVGSSLLINEDGNIAKPSIRSLVKLIIELRNKGKQVLLVSSGAVAAANLKNQNKTSLAKKQALASIGQVELIKHYQREFSKKKILIGQILFSKHSISNRLAYLNARNTLRELLSLNALPIVNENDSLSTDEFKFGDNDTLGALACGLFEADLYLLLSNVEGFFSNYEKRTLVPYIKEIDKEIYGQIKQIKSKHGTGGMYTKLKACELVQKWGIPAFLTSGKDKNLYDKIFVKEQGTLFLNPNTKKVSSKKIWLGSNDGVSGEIYIDDGAKIALLKKKSLLPAGVKEVKGKFEAGDFCKVINKKKIFAQGIVNFSFSELKIIQGLHSKAIEKELGYPANPEVIHIDNLIFLN